MGNSVCDNEQLTERKLWNNSEIVKVKAVPIRNETNVADTVKWQQRHSCMPNMNKSKCNLKIYQSYRNYKNTTNKPKAKQTTETVKYRERQKERSLHRGQNPCEMILHNTTIYR